MRFDVIHTKSNRIVAFVQDATIYRIDENGHAVDYGPCEENEQAVKTTYLERLSNPNVPSARFGIKIVRRWVP